MRYLFFWQVRFVVKTDPYNFSISIDHSAWVSHVGYIQFVPCDKKRDRETVNHRKHKYALGTEKKKERKKEERVGVKASRPSHISWTRAACLPRHIVTTAVVPLFLIFAWVISRLHSINDVWVLCIYDLQECVSNCLWRLKNQREASEGLKNTLMDSMVSSSSITTFVLPFAFFSASAVMLYVSARYPEATGYKATWVWGTNLTLRFWVVPPIFRYAVLQHIVQPLLII